MREASPPSQAAAIALIVVVFVDVSSVCSFDVMYNERSNQTASALLCTANLNLILDRRTHTHTHTQMKRYGIENFCSFSNSCSAKFIFE